MRIIFDTDIGNDCDDAGALSIMYNLKEKYDFDVSMIGSSTSYIEGAYSIGLINEYYNQKCLIGQNTVGGWPSNNATNLYTHELCKMHSNYKTDEVFDYVRQMRKAYTSSEENVTLIIVGPFNAINLFLNSGPDDISSMTGKELINFKTEHVYVMGGKFTEEEIWFANSIVVSEWNIKCDIKSAQNFLRQVEVPITFLPFECGLYLTGENLIKDKNNPVYECYKIYSDGLRFSWDPATVYYAITKDTCAFIESPKGIISIDDNGVTTYIPDSNGKHTYLKCNNTNEKLKEIINKYLY